MVLNEYTGYFDESGIEKESPAMTVAGYLATEENWKAFKPEWDEVLKRFGISRFHMVDFAQSLNEFSSWKDNEDKRRQFMGELIGIIDHRITHAFSMSVFREDYDRVNRDYRLNEECDSPYAVCGLGVIHFAYQWKERHPDAQMKFIFHNGPLGKGKLLSIMERHGQLETIAFMKCHRALEGADFVAWEHRAYLARAYTRIVLNDDISPKMPRRTFELLQEKTRDRQSFNFLNEDGIRTWCDTEGIPRR